MSTADTPRAEPAELREEIARTRADLGDTVEELAAKTDVKARAKDAASDAAEKAKAELADAKVRGQEMAADLADQVRRRPLPLAAIGAAVVIAGVVIFVLRRRRV
jgi:head-tail adaptor